MKHSHTEQLEAVIIFEAGKIAREMQYPEFEAVMDGYVPMIDYAGTRATAVYLLINNHFKITTCVFFLADFNERGMISKGWNVPMQRLAELAARGPDLGAGAIKLACFSQCPMELQQNNLWDPCMDPGRNSFVLLRKAVQSNRLGLVFSEVSKSEAPLESREDNDELRRSLEHKYTQAMRNRLAQTLKTQRLRIQTLNSRMQARVKDLKREHQQRLESYQQALTRTESEKQGAEAALSALQEELDLHVRKAESIREYYEHKLSNQRTGENSQAEQIELTLEREFEHRLNEIRQQLEQQLDMKEMELFYRQQRETALTDELEQVRKDHEALLNNGAEQLLTRLQSAGVSFVVHEPGAGQMTIPVDRIGDFINNPTAYVADYCGVSESLYKSWQDHYHSPYCNAINDDGEECGKGVKRILNPCDFHDGESNRCSEHQHIGACYQATSGKA
ncbi:MAG TPA: hypothetical protein VIC08_02005 [Cellvibrionaceae bacterium]